MTKPKFEQVYKTKRLTYAQLRGLYDLAPLVEAAIKAEQTKVERLLVRAFELDLWPVSVYDQVTGEMTEYKRPGFWLRWRLRWALWRKKRKEKA